MKKILDEMGIRDEIVKLQLRKPNLTISILMGLAGGVLFGAINSVSQDSVREVCGPGMCGKHYMLIDTPAFGFFAPIVLMVCYWLLERAWWQLFRAPQVARYRERLSAQNSSS